MPRHIAHTVHVSLSTQPIAEVPIGLGVATAVAMAVRASRSEQLLGLAAVASPGAPRRRLPAGLAAAVAMLLALLLAPLDAAAEPPALTLVGDEAARLEAGEVVLRTRAEGRGERWAQALYLFDATPAELFEIVTRPETLARIYDEIAVYETLEVHDDGRSTHGIARMGWPLPSFEYWMRTRTDPHGLWNAWQQTRGDFAANDGYWRFTWDAERGKTIGTLAMHLELAGSLSWVPDDLLVRMQSARLPASMHAVEGEVARVRAEEPDTAARRQAPWRTVADARAL